MKAPRSVADVMGLWAEHAAKCEATGVPVTHLYKFAANAKVTLNEVLGAALASTEPAVAAEVTIEE